MLRNDSLKLVQAVAAFVFIACSGDSEPTSSAAIGENTNRDTATMPDGPATSKDSGTLDRGDTAIVDGDTGDSGLPDLGTSDTGGAASPPPIPGRCASQPRCVDVQAQPEDWTLVGPSVFLGLDIRGDSNGDGIVDALVRFETASEEAEAYLVYGPLKRTLVLPTDADVYIPAETYLAGDIDGDGLVDLFVDSGAPGADRVVLAPFSAVVDVAMSAATIDLPGEALVDLDGDGRTDYVEPGFTSTPIWFGDHATWGVRDPDLVLETDCGQNPNSWKIEPQAHADVDGDGTPEIWLRGEWFMAPADCLFFRLPASTRGTVDLNTHPDVLQVPNLIDMGDQNTDGIIDFNEDDSDEILAPPITFDAHLSASGETVVIMESRVSNEEPVPLGGGTIDLNADGIPDLVGVEITTAGTESELRLYTGGDAGGLASGNIHFTLISDLYPTGEPVYIERGQAIWPFFDKTTPWVRFIELGPATTVAR